MQEVHVMDKEKEHMSRLKDAVEMKVKRSVGSHVQPSADLQLPTLLLSFCKQNQCLLFMIRVQINIC